MRIVLDLSTVRTRGTTVYAKGLLGALAGMHGPDDIITIVAPSLSSQLALPPGHGLTLYELPAAATRRSRVVEQIVGLRSLLRTLDADVLFAPFGFAPLWPPCPVLLAVRDPSPYIAKTQRYSRRIRIENAIRAVLVRRSCAVAQQVLFPSQFAADVLGDALDLPKAKRLTVYHGTDHALWSQPTGTAAGRAVLQRHGLDGRQYVLFVSQLYRQKHPETLIEGFARWADAAGDTSHQLVFAGQEEEPAFAQDLKELVARLGIGERVRFLGMVPHEDLPSLYQHASAFVLPTSMETFGHPLVEAMSSGAPVVCADTPIAREICGSAAAYFPVCDADALAACLSRAIGGDGCDRDAMIRRGREQAAQFSWEREARETLAALRALGARRSREIGSPA